MFCIFMISRIFSRAASVTITICPSSSLGSGPVIATLLDAGCRSSPLSHCTHLGGLGDAARSALAPGELRGAVARGGGIQHQTAGRVLERCPAPPGGLALGGGALGLGEPAEL